MDDLETVRQVISTGVPPGFKRALEALSRIERDLNDTWKAAEDAGLRADRNSDYLAKVNQVVEAARAVHGGWSDDPPPHKMQWGPLMSALREALGALDG